MPVMPTVAPKHNTDAPRVAYILFPPPAASVTVCSNQPLTCNKGVSLLPCDGVLQLQWFPLTLVYLMPTTTSASKLQDIMVIH